MGLEIINDLKKAKGLTNDDLSRLSGIPKDTIAKITAGITQNPKIETLKAIAKVLGCSLEDFDDDSPFKKINESFDYFIEKQMLLLGYEVIFDAEDGYVCLVGKEGTFEITEIQLDDLRSSVKSYLNFKIHEMENNSRKIGGAKIKPHSRPHVPNKTARVSKHAHAYDLPLLGKTAAGTPLTYGDPIHEIIGVKAIPKGAEFALSVAGDSMEPLIKDGSIIFVKPQIAAENGEIVVAEADGEVTCKKFYRYKDGRIELRSINPKYEPITEFKNFRIIGKVLL